MNIILGFGSSEEQQRENVYNWILDNLRKHYNDREDKRVECFNESIIEKFKTDFKLYQEEIQKKYDEADKAEIRPERYYHISYGARIAYDYDTLFVRVEFWHINSRHPMSPDGMALFTLKKTYTFTAEEL